MELLNNFKVQYFKIPKNLIIRAIVFLPGVFYFLEGWPSWLIEPMFVAMSRYHHAVAVGLWWLAVLKWPF